MAWQDRYQQASFRGVQFAVEAAEHTIGRRLVAHEYPLRNKPMLEDLGRRTREFVVEAILVGADYMEALDRLIAAFEQEGPGQLVHPYLGQMQVSVPEARVRQTTAEGGMARVSITFLESGALEFPTGSTSTAEAVRAKADALQTAAGDGFELDYEPGKSDSAVNPVLARLQAWATQIEQVARTARAASVLGPLGLVQLREYSSQLIDLLSTPAMLRSVIVMVSDGIHAEADAALSLRPYRMMFSTGASRALAASPAGTDQVGARNANLLAGFTLGLVVANWARVASVTEFSTLDDAQGTQEALTDAIDQLREWPDISPEADAELAALRTAVVQDITARGANLKRLARVTVPAAMPALTLAYRLYGTTESADDIVSRNRVANPLFMPAGQPLEVLTDGA